MSEWQPIESAPKDKDVLAICVGASVASGRVLRAPNQCVVVRWGEGWDYWRTIPGNWAFNPTHWMPLPDPPQERP